MPNHRYVANKALVLSTLRAWRDLGKTEDPDLQQEKTFNLLVVTNNLLQEITGEPRLNLPRNGNLSSNHEEGDTP